MTKQKELYRFTEGALNWTYTSSDIDEVYNSELYSSFPIGRNEITNRNEISKANITVSIPYDSEIGARWLRSIFDVVISLTIFVKEGVDVSVIWKGRLASIKPQDKDIKLVFESVFTSLRRPGLRLKYQRSCPHVLYGRGCNLDKASFAVSAEILSASDTVILATEAALYPDSYFNAGMIEGPDGTLRFIISHSGTELIVIRPLDSLNEANANKGATTLYANIYPGCNRTKEVCASIFNNILNNGSFPYIPLKNPMGGTSIV